jgi:hypothetical protein
MTVMFQAEVWVVTPCSVVVGHQQFRCPCCLHLQGEVAGMGENSMYVVYRPGQESDGRCCWPIGSVEGELLWLPLCATGVRVPVASPDLADREQDTVAMSIKLVIAWAAAVRTPS